MISNWILLNKALVCLEGISLFVIEMHIFKIFLVFEHAFEQLNQSIILYENDDSSSFFCFFYYSFDDESR